MTAPIASGTPAPGSAGPATPPAVAPPAPPAAEPPAPPAPPSPPGGDPNWLPQRLKEAKATERRELLASFGVTDPEQIKAALAKTKELEEANLTEKQKAEKQIKDLSGKADAGERVSKRFAAMVETAFAKLTDKEREAIDKIAAGDAEKRADLIDLLNASKGDEPPPAPGARPPANNTPPGAPPPPPPAGGTQTPYDKWVALQKTDPMAANIFYQVNSHAIETSPRG